MVWMPFACLGAGLALGMRSLSDKMLKGVDFIINGALIVLMLTIGMNIGINPSVMGNLSSIGLNCVVISLMAIGFSILFVFLVEKTVLPLEELKEKIFSEKIGEEENIDHLEDDEEKKSPLLFIMPLSIILGILIGYFFLSENIKDTLGVLLTLSLVFLYTGVGVSLGTNRRVFKFIKVLGFKVIYISIAIFAGSFLGGLISGIILNVPLNISIISASGMSYYSLTGAYMTSVFGIEFGTYGFIVNVMREFFTVLLLPLIIKISKGSPIAAGAAGDMDTMLVPVTKFVGVELGLVTLITGTILTFFVPVILPILGNLL
jgi:uncharacterized membrane protein YbjE (DUF340 family)